jgi:hypothetical protein
MILRILGEPHYGEVYRLDTAHDPAIVYYPVSYLPGVTKFAGM